MPEPRNVGGVIGRDPKLPDHTEDQGRDVESAEVEAAQEVTPAHEIAARLTAMDRAERGPMLMEAMRMAEMSIEDLQAVLEAERAARLGPLEHAREWLEQHGAGMTNWDVLATAWEYARLHAGDVSRKHGNIVELSGRKELEKMLNGSIEHDDWARFDPDTIKVDKYQWLRERYASMMVAFDNPNAYITGGSRLERATRAALYPIIARIVAAKQMERGVLSHSVRSSDGVGYVPTWDIRKVEVSLQEGLAHDMGYPDERAMIRRSGSHYLRPSYEGIDMVKRFLEYGTDTQAFVKAILPIMDIENYTTVRDNARYLPYFQMIRSVLGHPELRELYPNVDIAALDEALATVGIRQTDGLYHRQLEPNARSHNAVEDDTITARLFVEELTGAVQLLRSEKDAILMEQQEAQKAARQEEQRRFRDWALEVEGTIRRVAELDRMITINEQKANGFFMVFQKAEKQRLLDQAQGWKTDKQRLTSRLQELKIVAQEFVGRLPGYDTVDDLMQFAESYSANMENLAQQRLLTAEPEVQQAVQPRQPQRPRQIQ